MATDAKQNGYSAVIKELCQFGVMFNAGSILYNVFIGQSVVLFAHGKNMNNKSVKANL